MTTRILWPELTLWRAIVYISATQMWRCLAVSVEIGISSIGHVSTLELCSRTPTAARMQCVIHIVTVHISLLDCEVITGIGCIDKMSTNETSMLRENCTVKMPGDSESGLADSQRCVMQCRETLRQLVDMTYTCVQMSRTCIICMNCSCHHFASLQAKSRRRTDYWWVRTMTKIQIMKRTLTDEWPTTDLTSVCVDLLWLFVLHLDPLKELCMQYGHGCDYYYWYHWLRIHHS